MFTHHIYIKNQNWVWTINWWVPDQHGLHLQKSQRSLNRGSCSKRSSAGEPPAAGADGKVVWHWWVSDQMNTLSLRGFSFLAFTLFVFLFQAVHVRSQQIWIRLQNKHIRCHDDTLLTATEATCYITTWYKYNRRWIQNTVNNSDLISKMI